MLLTRAKSSALQFLRFCLPSGLVKYSLFYYILKNIRSPALAWGGLAAISFTWLFLYLGPFQAHPYAFSFSG